MKRSQFGVTPSLVPGSFVNSPLMIAFASFVSHVGNLSFVCAIFRCSSFCSLCHHGASPVIISYKSTPNAQTSTAWEGRGRGRRGEGAVSELLWEALVVLLLLIGWEEAAAALIGWDWGCCCC